MTDRQPPSATGGADVEREYREFIAECCGRRPRGSFCESFGCESVEKLLDLNVALRAERDELQEIVDTCYSEITDGADWVKRAQLAESDNATLRAERDSQREDLGRSVETIDKLVAQEADLRREHVAWQNRALLAEALFMAHGRHAPECPRLGENVAACACGYARDWTRFKEGYGTATAPNDAALRVRAERAEAALREYGFHLADCRAALVWRDEDGAPVSGHCSCGWTELHLRLSREAKP